VDALLKAIFSDSSEEAVVALMLDHTAWCLNGERHLDTEEREFLVDVFFEIATSLELDTFRAEFKKRFES
jgi:hypothetical protein